ncbi:response regulator [Sulfitobacter sp. PS-8MA]|uniref:response regulator n=1 Tax=Sulfitobacter sp. PS-8MA TaxID=3237707 RepID=UPI0034C61CCE
MQPQNPLGIEVSSPRRIQALLLDDSSFDRQRIRRLGARIADLALALDEVGPLAELETASARRAYDVIFVDYCLAEGTGVQALERISNIARHHGAGRIMITGREDIGAAVEAMRKGCHDFLSKNAMSAEILRDAILNVISLARRSAQAQQQMAMQREIVRDCMVALKDAEVRDSIGAINQRELTHFTKAQPLQRTTEIDGMIAALADADEFIFAASPH